jgi:septal ring factor EnvC (AmiA/AmiB activator)
MWLRGDRIPSDQNNFDRIRQKLCRIRSFFYEKCRIPMKSDVDPIKNDRICRSDWLSWETINELIAANQALQTELNQLKTDYNQLKQDYDRVQAENKQFRNDIERMKFDIRLLLIKLNLYKKPPHRNDGKLVNID